MRAQRRPNQPVDPVIYCNYYLLLEKVYKFYTDYERKYADRLLLVKDEKIDGLSKQIGDQTKQIGNLTLMNENLTTLAETQSSQITDLKEMTKQLINHAEDRKIEVSMLNKKIDILFDFMISFAKMTIPMWVGSNVIKTQFDILTKNNTVSYGLLHLKIMFTVAFFEPLDEPVETTINDKTIRVKANMKQYFCCTNFADVGVRIKQLHKKHNETMFMLKPQAICLISCEINTERNILERMNIFPDNVFTTYSNKHKSFDLQVPKWTTNGVSDIFNTIVDNAKQERFQAYQMRIDGLKSADQCPINENILERITTADEAFFGDTLPFCQRFIDCYTKPIFDKDNELVEWLYIKSTSIQKKRPDMNASMSERTYNLKKILYLITQHTEADTIDNMVATGVISKSDINSLKELAHIEGLDVSEIEFPEDD